MTVVMALLLHRGLVVEVPDKILMAQTAMDPPHLGHLAATHLAVMHLTAMATAMINRLLPVLLLLV
jgi:hypothetical protein